MDDEILSTIDQMNEAQRKKQIMDLLRNNPDRLVALMAVESAKLGGDVTRTLKGGIVPQGKIKETVRQILTGPSMPVSSYTEEGIAEKGTRDLKGVIPNLDRVEVDLFGDKGGQGYRVSLLNAIKYDNAASGGRHFLVKLLRMQPSKLLIGLWVAGCTASQEEAYHLEDDRPLTTVRYYHPADTGSGNVELIEMETKAANRLTGLLERFYLQTTPHASLLETPLPAAP